MYFVSELRLSVVALMIIVPGAMFDISKNRFADVDTGVCQIINSEYRQLCVIPMIYREIRGFVTRRVTK